MIENSFSVSNNPDIVIYHNGFLFVGSQYGDWPTYNFVTEKINPITGELSASKDQGSDVAFGVDFSIHNDVLYRAYDKGIVALNDDLSVSYNVQDSDKVQAGKATTVNMEGSSLQVAYSVGGASIKFAENDTDNQKYVSGTNKEGRTIALTLAF